jgi:hypothetical protein
MAGPTLLLNLPKPLNYLIKLFTPFLPPSVAKKIMVVRGVRDHSFGGNSTWWVTARELGQNHLQKREGLARK